MNLDSYGTGQNIYCPKAPTLRIYNMCIFVISTRTVILGEIIARLHARVVLELGKAPFAGALAQKTKRLCLQRPQNVVDV
jgi:hypothetical protein